MRRAVALNGFCCGLLLPALVGCGETVHVRLTHDPGETAGCNQAIIQAASFYIRLVRVAGGEERTFEKCTQLNGVNPKNVSDLEDVLSRRSSFPDIPAGGTWSVSVQGFDDSCCRNRGKFPLLCGTTAGFSMPPEGDFVSVDLQCVFVQEVHETCPCSAPDWCPTDTCF